MEKLTLITLLETQRPFTKRVLISLIKQEITRLEQTSNFNWEKERAKYEIYKQLVNHV